jgi:hypothetical protein
VKPTPPGVNATWLVGAPAARAITVLEHLQRPDTDWLFAILPIGPGTGPKSWTSTTTLGITATINQINAFTAWINDYCAGDNRVDGIPSVDGHPWRLTTRQFRRTLAWFIARRPGGSIAGAIAYRHQAIQMFEGYAGTSDSGFRAEVESEQALARGEHLLAMIDRHEHTALTGPACPEAARRLDDLSRDHQFSGTVITDSRRLKRLMTQHDPAIYPGDYVTCVFNPDRALCLRRHDPVDRPTPLHCQPLECANVALTADNRDTWDREIAAAERHLNTTPPLPPLLAARLRDRQDAMIAFADRHRTKETP